MNLHKMTLKELGDLNTRIAQAIHDRKIDEKRIAKIKVMEIAAHHGLSLSDLTLFERTYISYWRQQRMPLRDIALMLGVEISDVIEHIRETEGARVRAAVAKPKPETARRPADRDGGDHAAS
ncbi:MAG: hypothetical protein AB1781_11085 [Pseudomonadota bacterium]